MCRGILVGILLALALPLAAQTSAPSGKASSKAGAASAAPVDRAYLQSIWDGWAAANLDKQAQFYVQGPNHLFFDVAPLKYTSWDDYRAGVAPSMQDAPKVTYTINDDIQIHPEGNITWVDGTLTMAGNTPQGKQSILLRWTAVLEQHDGRWLIAHEHVSAPAEPPQQ